MSTFKSTNQIRHLAIDIETVPVRPLEDYPSEVRAYLVQKIEAAKALDPTITYEKYASLHPSFGRIVCLSAGCLASDRHGNELIITKSFTGDELGILDQFNRQSAYFRNTFVHFNGLSFDVPFILTRMRLNRVPCMNQRFAIIRRFSFDPHLDLLEFYSQWDRAKSIPLGVLAELLGLPLPKADLSGSKICTAFAAGEIRRIGQHCEWDVATTLNLLRILVGGYDPVPPELIYSQEDENDYTQLATVLSSDSRTRSVLDPDLEILPSADPILIPGSSVVRVGRDWPHP